MTRTTPALHRLSIEIRPCGQGEGFDVDAACACGWAWVGWSVEAEAGAGTAAAVWAEHTADEPRTTLRAYVESMIENLPAGAVDAMVERLPRDVAGDAQ